jgi:PIN domain nuclease of toxin-antitoxin system
VIILDTHIWVWWVHGDAHLPERYNTYLALHEAQGLGVSVISCWEVAKLVEYGRLTLPCPVAEWLDQALAYPGISPPYIFFLLNGDMELYRNSHFFV